MSEAAERLLVRIDATTEQLRRELKRADDAVGSSSTSMDKRISKLKDRFDRLNKAMGPAIKAGALAFAGAAALVIKNTSAQEKSIAQLEATLRSTGRYTPELSKSLQDYASSLQSLTTFGDEAIIASQGLLLTFTQVGGEAFPRAQKAILDVATAMGTDLKSATLQVGKALNDPILGLTALQRSGIQFSDAQKEMIKGMVEAGDVAGAQAEILKELETQFGGSAEAARNTLGGALQSLKNAFGDLLEGDTKGEGIKGVTGAIEELIAILSDPGTKRAFSGFIESGAGVITWAVQTTKVMGFLVDEVKAMFGVIGDQDYVRITEKIDNLKKAIAISDESMFPWVRARADKYREELAQYEDQLDRLEKAQASLNVTSEDAGDIAGDLAVEVERVKTATAGAAQAIDAMGNDAEEAVAQIAEAAPELEELSQTAEKESKALTTAYSRAIERIQDGFGDFFQKILMDGSASFGDLLDLFKRTIAEMLASAASSRLFAAFGLGGASSGAMASGGISGLMGSAGGGLSGLWSGIGSMGAGAMNMVGHGATFLGGMGIPGMDGLATSAYQQGMTMTPGMAIGGMAAGFAGNFLGSKVFGETSGIGSTLGGTIGMAIGGPLGAGIGSFLGSGVESLFGGKNNGDNQGRVSFSGMTGGTASGVGKSFNPENVSSVQQLSDALLQFSQQIGGSSARFDVTAGNNSGISLDGRSYGQDVGAFMADAMRKIIDGAEQLSPAVRDLVSVFRGGAEDTAAYAQALIGLDQMAGVNVVSQAIEQITAANDASTTMMSAYQNQIDMISTLRQNFDGSAVAAQELTSALAQNQQAAYQMAVAISQISDQIGGMLASSAQQIRESVMSDEELFSQRMSRRDSLFDSLSGMDDPARLAEAAAEINRLNTQLFQSIENATKDDAERFAQYAEKTDEIAQQRLDSMMQTLETTQRRQNEELQSMMREAASMQQQAANTFMNAAQMFAAAAGSFRAEVNA